MREDHRQTLFIDSDSHSNTPVPARGEGSTLHTPERGRPVEGADGGHARTPSLDIHSSDPVRQRVQISYQDKEGTGNGISYHREVQDDDDILHIPDNSGAPAGSLTPLASTDPAEAFQVGHTVTHAGEAATLGAGCKQVPGTVDRSVGPGPQGR